VIDTLAGEIGDMCRAIFNRHVPPHASDLDAAAELDAEFRPRYKGGAPMIAAAGSTYNSGRLDGVLAELEGDNVHRVRLTSG
jgi:hypothetical protein